MNDTTQTNTPEPNPPLQALPHELLIAQVLTAFDSYIVRVVDARVNQIFEAHATVKQLDEQWEERIKGFVQEAIDAHEVDYQHVDRDEIDDRIGTYIAHHDYSDTIQRAVQEIITDGDYPNEERVTEMIDEADIEDRVKEVLRNI
jgi:hypothetical protein